ncbi:MAG TPA: rhodanese-like domain-containing protein [Flavisolibacter sp.]|nr:rhodanese-like domain-containing protein [Flavisolibacter sp.]
MNTKTGYLFFIAFTLITAALVFSSFKQQQEEPWTQDQLLEPSDLARILNNPKAKQPYVYSVGPDATIKNSIDIGPADNKENLNELKKQLSKLPKDANIVIYCGCCPFIRCPNIRPAFTLLNEMKFTHQKLLSLQHNIKIDWIDKGFPVSE